METEVKVRRSTQKQRLALLALGAAVGTFAVWLILDILKRALWFHGSTLKAPLIVLILGLLFVLALWLRLSARAAVDDAYLEDLRTRKRIRERLLVPDVSKSEVPYFEALVSINVENLSGYYSQVRLHTNRSFKASLSTGLLGFLLLAVGLAIGLYSNDRSVIVEYISTGAGVVTEFIAAVFFYLYNSTVRQMKEYHDSLLSVQNVLLALKLVGDTKQPSDRLKMIGQMLVYLLGGRERGPSELFERKQVSVDGVESRKQKSSERPS
jgi:hypothetical protein